MQTARLRLRAVVDSDAARIADLAGDWDVASMTGRIPYPYSADAAQHWISGVEEGEQVFGIERDAEFIGICGFTIDANGDAELGYWIGKPYWGHGYATEAASAVMAYGFTKAGVRRFVCRHLAGNPGSARVIQKLGFKYVGDSTGWCEARQCELPALSYELRRPWTMAIRALAS
ncbi:GCN5-related N-acetyltransferase [Hyphomicrobium denitrificans ATCC 51888]|uniref:GCN5-related N-acetyltransferase n=1 Tax=Hyphomicrobium denitrificans (strain ATCC 51888 / DSM 1869 / NCIMB 11706 / TK 0415) TaxID=582899 RepID=D8JQA7_HYPDA|nr:GNAT family N-acetyltransferase [Hyphomicrobium denitrificans]ADJ22028.1 GCN5-related N-acetyltransferase [Hyphomicrobium denitrificans ATCC 51888]